MPKQAFEVIEERTVLTSPALFLRVQELAELHGTIITVDPD